MVTKRGNKIGFNKYQSQWMRLPNGVTSHEKLPNGVSPLPNGVTKLPNGADSKETIQKKLIQKKLSSDAPASGKRTLQNHLHPLAVFTLAKGMKFNNEHQIQGHISRYSRESGLLRGYSADQILRAFFRAYDESGDRYDVTLETVGKKIAMYHDWEVPHKYKNAFREILAEFEKIKDTMFSSSSPLICKP